MGCSGGCGGNKFQPKNNTASAGVGKVFTQNGVTYEIKKEGNKKVAVKIGWVQLNKSY